MYKALRLTPEGRLFVYTLLKHVEDMFPTNGPPGHDWQHAESQIRLWMTIGGSVLEEEQFAGKVDPLVPILVAAGHDLNRLSLFEPIGRSHKKKTDGLVGEALEQAVAHNAAITAFNERAEERKLCMYGGFLQLFIPFINGKHIRTTLAVLREGGGKNNPNDRPELIVSSDLDKAITGYFYAWRCACVGTGVRVNHVAKNYLIAPICGANKGAKVIDEELGTWRDDLEWAKDWDPCEDPNGPFIIRSKVLHEFADPGFKQLRDMRAGLTEQLRAIGFEI